MIGALAGALARTAVAVVVGLSLIALAPSVVAGWWSGVVVSGSMTPAIRVGDVVVTRPTPGTPEPGRVVAVRDPRDRAHVLVHRLQGVDADGRLVTRGDANAGPDGTPVPRADLIGVAVVRVPMVGLPVVWARAGDRRSLALGLAALTLLTVLATRRAGDAPPPRAAGRHARHLDPVEERLVTVPDVTAPHVTAPHVTAPHVTARLTGPGGAPGPGTGRRRDCAAGRHCR